MEGHPFHDGLLLREFLQIKSPFQGRKKHRLPSVSLIPANRRSQRPQVNSDLVHPSRYGPALHQSMLSEQLQRIKPCLCLLAFPGNPDGSIVLLQYSGIYENLFKIVQTISYSMVNLTHLSVLELHAQVPVSLWVTCNGQYTRGILVQTVTYLRIRFCLPDYLENIKIVVPVLQGGNKRRLIDQ